MFPLTKTRSVARQRRLPHRSLAPNAQSTYVIGADGYFPVVSRSASRCRAGSSKSGDFQRFPIPPEPALRAADKERRFRARAAARPEATLSTPGTDFDSGATRSSALRVRCTTRRRGALRRAGACSDLPGGALPPLFLDGPTLDAPDCVADPDPRSECAAAHRFRAIPFGAARHLAIWPSPHPRIRWTVASQASAGCARHETRPPPS